MCHVAAVRLNEAAACRCRTHLLRRAGLFDEKCNASAASFSMEKADTPCSRLVPDRSQR